MQHLLQKSYLAKIHDRVPPLPRLAFQISLTFVLVVVSWTFFRSNSLWQAREYLTAMFGFGRHRFWEGAAVIGGDTGGIRHQIEDGVNGFLVSSVEQAAQRIVQLIRDEPMRRKLGERARQTVR